MGHPSRIPVWLRWDQSVIYFVTICVADRKPVLANKEALDALTLSVSKLQHWHVLAAILMPDHLHVLAAPTKERNVKLGSYRYEFNELLASGALALQVISNASRDQVASLAGNVSQPIES